MRKQCYLLFSLALIVLFAVTAIAQNKPKDPFGKPDKAEVIIRQVKPNHFSFELTWDNDEKLAALTYPLLVKGKDFRMRYDSVSWKGRAEYFAVKSSVPKDSLQQVLVGFLADMDGTRPPLKEGKGMVATLYFTADLGGVKKMVDVCDVVVDSTFMPPSNTLYGVTQDGTGTVRPAYAVTRLTAAGQPASCK